MGSITIDEAARYLNVSTRTISTYISQGIITYHKKEGSNRKYISTEDVSDLKEATESGAFSIKKFRQLQAKVRRIEANVEVLMRILDTKQIPLGLQKEECIELFEAALLSENQSLTEDHAEAWLPVLMRIDENDLNNIEKHCRTKVPWKPFLDLCVSLIVFVLGSKDYTTSISLQNTHKELAEARRRIRLSALIYIEEKGAKIEVDTLSIRCPDSTVDIVKKVLKSRHK